MNKGVPIRQTLTVLVALPAVYVCFFIYRTGYLGIALAVLAVIALGVYIYLSPSAETFRYLYPGLLGFGLFVILPLVYTVYISFTKYSSSNLLSYERSLGLLRQDTYTIEGAPAYKYKLQLQDDGKYIMYLEGDKDATQRLVSEPFSLTPDQKISAVADPVKVTPFPVGEEVQGKALTLADINRGKLLVPLRGLKFELPDETLEALTGLTKYTARQRVWEVNDDGSLTSRLDGTVVKPDYEKGCFVNDQGKKVGVGFRTGYGFGNYLQILQNPRILKPFLRIFVWTLAFAILSVLFSFSVGMFLAVMLQQPDLKFRRVYRTLFILPYAVPAILSILILKGLFNQEFGAVNELLRGIFGFAPEWETDPWGARAMVLLVNTWLGYPYMMLIATGMLQAIPTGIYEASAIDGSNARIDFFKLTLPLVLPPMIPILIFSFAFNFNNFNLIFLLTKGGPQMVGGAGGETDLLVTYTYNLAFLDSGTNFGLASAIASILFIIVGFLAWINLRLAKEKAKL